ncbi:acetyl/propionyl/methylcrotonyl-CoA carboxylase subunit alpha [Isoalcanivorax indicus]|uniref:acetyl/propionyl/methylcrotonyl-CoA carboxylase subunit alpha n=1 Tax=Isoalcanivorax indicus TaxID=2202653 RepID=UPI000DB968F8|nr:acetyl/propionyl/methylcrotonyl-CoA carboxylase subunit alpha [Isoalcanivorax indicus]
MIQRLLIANRGEIACRIMRTCARLGIETVAVYSDADSDLPHVRMADHAVHLGPAPARDSYLDISKIMAAARQSGADAIHPGYGFLSENPHFAEACEAAGITFVGPQADAIRLMGDKAAARQHMARHKVPVLPGFDEEGADDAALKHAATEVGFPLLIKAVAGGGGKGMRVVNNAQGFEEALQAARREARNAFGDDRVLLERYLPRARHVEVQVFADTHGNAVHLFERDCSVQRRHQKVIEEAPAPGVDPTLRERLGEAAVRAAQSIQYRGAGTVEFLLAPDGEFFFMEMNTRLQVEHPVTELITGEDLVAWQLTVADGKPLPKAQSALQFRGHAMEVRLYAEDPAQQFMPSSGLLEVCHWPTLPGLRIDTGFVEGNRVSDHYDPMLAKVIVFGEDREQARRQLQRSLCAVHLGGVRHNTGFLVKVLNHPAFIAADLSTRFLEEHDELLTSTHLPDRVTLFSAAALLWRDLLSDHAGQDPWQRLSGWQGLLPARFHTRLALDDEADSVMLEASGENSWQVRVGETVRTLRWRSAPEGTVFRRGRLHTEEADREFSACVVGRHLHLFADGYSWCLTLDPAFESGAAGQRGAPFAAPMSGTVVALHVKPDSRVAAGDPVITMEAMKMEHTLRAPVAGKVTALPFAAGDTVSEGTLLVTFDPDETEA